MTLLPGRPAVAVMLPRTERVPVMDELRSAGYDPVAVEGSDGLADLLATRPDIAVGILDMDGDPDDARRAGELLRADGAVPALRVVNPATLDQLDLTVPCHEDDEYLTRPYTAESVRWRIEAMVIRAAVVDDGTATVLADGIEGLEWSRRGQLVAVFSPKGGVGKTMIAVNLAAALTSRGKRVLLVDADTVTGHIPTSLGMDGVGSVVDAWRDELDGGPVLSFDEQASAHPSGLKVLSFSASPIHTELLEPQRVAHGLVAARRGADVVVVDLHPSYGALNRAVIEIADRIVVPITPDLPAIRATLRLVELADELGVRNRMSLVVNRAQSGVAIADLERAIGLPVFGTIRSAGMLVVQSLNEGRTLVERAPREQISQEFLALADRVLGVEPASGPAKARLRLFGRQVAARA